MTKTLKQAGAILLALIFGFAVLKITGVITISWFWLMGGIAMIPFMLIAGFLVMVFSWIYDAYNCISRNSK